MTNNSSDRSRFDTFKIATVILAALMVLLIAYIAYDKYQETQSQQMQLVFQNGYNRGVQDSVVQIYQNTNNCQIASVIAQNQTRRLADVECFIQAQQAAQQAAQQTSGQ